MEPSCRLLKRKRHKKGDLAFFYTYHKEKMPGNHAKRMDAKHPTLWLYRMGPPTEEGYDYIKACYIVKVQFTKTRGPIWSLNGFLLNGKTKPMEDIEASYRQSDFYRNDPYRYFSYLGTHCSLRYEDIKSAEQAKELLKPFRFIL